MASSRSPKGPAVRVGASDVHGTGVFAGRDFDEGDVIEQCPVLLIDADEAPDVAGTMLGNYVYEWDDGYALALGYGSLYNHDRHPNARYEMDDEAVEITIVAWRRIRAGEEIFINYNGDPEVTKPVWFEDGYDPDA